MKLVNVKYGLLTRSNGETHTYTTKSILWGRVALYCGLIAILIAHLLVWYL